MPEDRRVTESGERSAPASQPAPPVDAPPAVPGIVMNATPPEKVLKAEQAVREASEPPSSPREAPSAPASNPPEPAHD